MFTGKKNAVFDPEAALQEQLQDDRYIKMRAETSLVLIDNLEIPRCGDTWIPGLKLIPVGLAKKSRLAELVEDTDPLQEIPTNAFTPQPVGAVDGNLIATFVDGVKGEHLFDVLNSTLLAQLGSNAKLDRGREPIAWTKSYIRVLQGVGWVVRDFDFFHLRPSDTQFGMDSAILDVIKKVTTQRQAEIVNAGLRALQELSSDDRRQRIFRRNSVEGEVGNFQVASVEESATGVVSMRLGTLNFRTGENVTDVLRHHFRSGSTEVKAARTRMVLNEQVYSRLRQRILEKLGNQALELVGGLELEAV